MTETKSTTSEDLTSYEFMHHIESNFEKWKIIVA